MERLLTALLWASCAWLLVVGAFLGVLLIVIAAAMLPYALGTCA